MATGTPSENGIKTEVLDLHHPNMKCDLLPESKRRIGAFGGLIQNVPVICGGRGLIKVKYANQDSYEADTYEQDCFVIGEPNKTIMMTEKRYHAASIVLNQTTIWAVGGGNGRGYSNSTEFISFEKPPTRGLTLPFTSVGACMVQYEDSIYLIAGGQNGYIFPSSKTWIIDLHDNSLKEGPPLNTKRTHHSCGKMNIDGKVVIVVAGGLSRGPDQSVELLDPSSADNWKIGRYTYMTSIRAFHSLKSCIV